jgi:hypothetical protein
MYNFLTVGFDCSPAGALRGLNLRSEALPFDWVVSNISSLEKCFQDNFMKYHTNLKLEHSKTRLIDEYGFMFPHDYPLMDINKNTDNVTIDRIGEGIIGEEKNKIITNNWQQFYSIAKEKYDRRIKRFLNIVNDDKPIILLCRYSTKDVLLLRNLFLKYYNKQNIFYINSSNEKIVDNFIINCNTEVNGNWNDIEIWKKYINLVILLNSKKINLSRLLQ